MPVYQYKCKNCNNIIDIYTACYTSSNTTEVNCDFCSTKMNRLIITSPVIIYNGKGFYSTDNKKKEIVV